MVEAENNAEVEAKGVIEAKGEFKAEGEGVGDGVFEGEDGAIVPRATVAAGRRRGFECDAVE